MKTLTRYTGTVTLLTLLALGNSFVSAAPLGNAFTPVGNRFYRLHKP